MNVEACKLLSLKLNFPYTTPVLRALMVYFPYIPVVPCDHAYKYVLCAVVSAEGFALQCFHYYRSYSQQRSKRILFVRVIAIT